MEISARFPAGLKPVRTQQAAMGLLIVGWGRAANGTERAFRWTEGAGMQALDGADSSYALDVSDDGLAVAGYAGFSAGTRAFRWTTTGGMQDLGAMEGDSSRYPIHPRASATLRAY